MVARGACVVLLGICLPVLSARAQTQGQPGEAERKADLAAYLADAKTYEIVIEGSPAARLELVRAAGDELDGVGVCVDGSGPAGSDRDFLERS